MAKITVLFSQNMAKITPIFNQIKMDLAKNEKEINSTPKAMGEFYGP